MLSSLSKLRELPDQTRVWCAPEFTLRNLQFAVTVDTDNPDLHERFAQVKATRSRNEATIPSILGVEKRTNPFLRWENPVLQRAVNGEDPVQTFARLRGRQDKFWGEWRPVTPDAGVKRSPGKRLPPSVWVIQ